MMEPIQAELDGLKYDVRDLKDELAAESKRFDEEQEKVKQELDSLSRDMLNRDEFDELVDRATGALVHDLDGMKSRVGDLQRRVGAMQVKSIGAEWDSGGSPR